MLDTARMAGPGTMALRDPFALFVAHDQLPADVAPQLDRDFPKYGSAGFFPYDPADCGPAVRALVEEVTAPAFADASSCAGVMSVWFAQSATLASIESRLISRSTSDAQ